MPPLTHKEKVPREDLLLRRKPTASLPFAAQRTVAMDPILYLGVEGVLFRIRARSHTGECRAHRLSSPEPLSLLEPVSAIVAHETKLKIVLNSWLVADYGFRRLLRLLPVGIAQKAIGATISGNRLHSRPLEYRARAELLREDVARRKPTQITIVDASRSAIPTELLYRSICVSESDLKCPAEFAATLRRFVESQSTD
jgi:hypothetical protein